MNKNLSDRHFLNELKDSGWHVGHLKPDLVKQVLSRLREIAEREENSAIALLDMGLSRGKADAVKLEDLSDMVIGSYEEPTAVSLLFDMLSGSPVESCRLKSGEILFSKAILKVSDYKPEDIKNLKELLKSGIVADDAAIRNASMWCLFKLFGSDAFDIYGYALTHSSYQVKFDTARMIGFLKNKQAVPMLIKVLESEQSPKMRSVILWALGYLKDPRALQVLLEHLEDEDTEACGYAAWALGEIGGTEAVQALTRVMEDNSKHREVRNWAARGLLVARTRE